MTRPNYGRASGRRPYKQRWRIRPGRPRCGGGYVWQLRTVGGMWWPQGCVCHHCGPLMQLPRALREAGLR